jgi:hypothetical protein
MATQAPLFEAPNLDCLTDSPADMERAATALALMAEYARHKALAMRMRLNGNMGPARNAERLADLAYGSLPEWARW